jgi:tetratricopeptide (TPR) repeat protein
MRLCFPQHSPYPPRASGYTQIHRAPEPEATEANPEAYDLGTLEEAFGVVHPTRLAPLLYLTHHPDEDNDPASDWYGSSGHLAMLLASAFDAAPSLDLVHLWATGALDKRAELQGVEHVPEKLTLFAKHAPEQPALFLAPLQNRTHKLPPGLAAIKLHPDLRASDLPARAVLWVRSDQVPSLLCFLRGVPHAQAPSPTHVNISVHVEGDASNLSVAGRDIHHAPTSATPHEPRFPKRAHIFAGRTQELAQLDQHFSAHAGQGVVVAICALKGMPGVGKTYLAQHFIASHPERWPGGMHHLTVDQAASVDALLGQLAAELRVPSNATNLDRAICAALNKHRAVLLVENADSPDAAALAAQLLDRLPKVPAILTGRLDNLGATRQGWHPLKLRPFQDDNDALEQLRLELQDAPHALPQEAEQRELIQALGNLPLAIHLAAGYLRAGLSVRQFLQELQDHRLNLNTHDPTDPQRPRQVLHAAFASLLTLFREHAGKHADAWTHALRALSLASSAGFTQDLAQALSGLDDAFARMKLRAQDCALLDAQTTAKDATLHLHPLLAEWLRQDLTPNQTTDAQQRLAAFFATLTAEAPDNPTPDQIRDQGRRWTAAKQDLPTLLRALQTLPTAPLYLLLQPSLDYAQAHGPYTSWIAACQRLRNDPTTDDEPRSNALWQLAVLAQRAGDLKLALNTATAKLDLERTRGNKHEAALASGQIADILQALGKLDEALRIRQQEELPVYESLGDVRSRAVTMGKIADILQARGKLDDALRILQDEILLAFESLGDVRSRAVTMGKIASILQARGKLDDALRIRQQEELPVYESLGDVRSRAVTMGYIADILQVRGKLDDALQIRQQEELPIYESLGDVRSRAVTIGYIASILQARGKLDEAIAMRREELGVYEELGDEHNLLAGRTNLAISLAMRGRGEDGPEILQLLMEAYRAAVEMEIPDAEQIAGVMEQIFGRRPGPAAP